MKDKNLTKKITESALKSNKKPDDKVEHISNEEAEQIEGGDIDFGCTTNSNCGGNPSCGKGYE